MSRGDNRRLAGAGWAILFLVLMAPLLGVSWWLRGRDVPAAMPDPVELAVVCLGRVDSLHPVTALDVLQPGRVATVLVSEGQTVQQGAVLLQLEDEAYRLRVREAEAAWAAAQVEKEAAEQEQRGWPHRLAAQQAAVAAARERYELARKVLEEKSKASKFQTVSAAELLVAESEVRHSQRLWEAEEARWREMQSMDPALKVRLAEARCRSAQVAIQQAEKAVRDCLLTAPSDGQVLRIQVHKGEAVSPGGMQPAILFRPAGPLVVRAELEQEFIGRVREGMPAWIQDDARVDSPIWSGRVLRLAPWISRRRNLPVEPGDWSDSRTAECLVSIEGDTTGLLIGQRMRVRIGSPPPVDTK
ncbi:MAG: biotin/lipoyl-binding protein [Gemmataceae bacterium]|nr:biotin/lipoyl-binding protein [Gemmataceae bacterium]MCS7271439.1 biotin/lipoyl-binding protein [Gemmataceae bacterium]MDW8241967.1 biotin/lipoyl-binding protein [Thermogemmata sp.]